jgi:hypothetical protein
MAEALGATRTDIEIKVGKWLAANTDARPLAEAELQRYKTKGARCGWRLDVAICDRPTALDLVIDSRFPRSRPRVALAEPPAFPSYPHVEEDGRLCILEDSDELDHSRPIAIDDFASAKDNNQEQRSRSFPSTLFNVNIS